MAYFDYSLTDTGAGPGQGIREIGDALTQSITALRQKKQFEEKLAFDREQEARKFAQNQGELAYQHRTQDAREKRDQFEFTQKQAKFKSDQAMQVQKALAAGNPQLAAAIAAETSTFDPASGQVAHGKLTPGQTRDVGPAPEEPPMPMEAPEAPPHPPEIAARRKALALPQPEPGAMVGPIPSAEERRHAEIQRIGTQPPSVDVPDVEGQLAAAEKQRQAEVEQRGRYEAGVTEARAANERSGQEQQARLDRYPAELAQAQREKARFDELTASLPARRQEHAAAAHQAELERPYALQFGDEPPVTMDVGTQRYATREAAANDFLASLPPNLSPQDRAAAANAHAAILAGDDPQKAIVAYNKERAGISEHGFKDVQGDKRDINRIEVAKINARKPGIMLSEKRFEAGLDKDRRKETRGDIEHWLKAEGLEAAPKQAAQLNLSIRQLKGNPAEQQAALVGMARATQGDNRFSDADYRVFVQHGGVGALDQAEGTIQKLIDGGFGEQRLAVASQMGAALKAVFDQRLREGSRRAAEQFVANDIYDPAVAESVLEQRLGAAYQRKTPRRGGPPEVNARRAGAAKAGVSRTVKLENIPTDELLNALGGSSGP